MSNTQQLRDYRRTRLFVASIVFVGVAVSVAVNQLDAHTWIGKGLAGFPPVSLLLTLEGLTRIPTSKRLGGIARVAATIGVASTAGWLSYWHMVAAVADHEETALNAHIWPITVDGLMVVMAVGMVELGARIRVLKSQPQRVTDADASATELIKAVDAIKMTPAEAVEDMRKDPYWGQRLGGSKRRAAQPQ
jgi:hypothetical protein